MKCKQCKSPVETGDPRNKFCCFSCYNTWRKGRQPKNGYTKGQTAWNKGIKGLHLSPSSEFKSGHNGTSRSPVGTETMRLRSRQSETARWFVKTAQPNTWKERSKVVWEKHFGPIPRGLIVHHIDEDTENDHIDNLSLITRAGHARLHALNRR